MNLSRSLSTRSVKKIDRPKPLKSRSDFTSSVDDLMTLIENVSQCISKKNYIDLNLMTANLAPKLKLYGQKVEEAYKDQLDKAFITFRNGCREEEIDLNSRTNLLHLVELRAMSWNSSSALNQYYSSKGSAYETNWENMDGATSPTAINHILGPGELIKSSGKYQSPMKMPGKSYCKDEVVIRNADSGKVMGIRGRRVHMIEELSETVISFQKVNPGAKERLVQITGPDEEKIGFAKSLIEDTIKRNASPVREVERDIVGSNSSLSTASEEDNTRLIVSGRNGSNPWEEFKYTHSVKNGPTGITMFSDEIEPLKKAKLILESIFNYNVAFMDGFIDNDSSIQGSAAHPVNSVEAQDNAVVGSPVKNEKVSEPKPSQPKETSDSAVPQDKRRVLIMYSREFLMECSSLKCSLALPMCWEHLSTSFPGLITLGKHFDATTYLQQYDNRQISVLPVSTEDENLDSE